MTQFAATKAKMREKKVHQLLLKSNFIMSFKVIESAESVHSHFPPRAKPIAVMPIRSSRSAKGWKRSTPDDEWFRFHRPKTFKTNIK